MADPVELAAAEETERLALVNSIEETRGYPLVPNVRRALLAVSRAHFVPYYCRQERPGVWVKHEARSLVYRDQALVTRVDERGRPLSSSSMPSIMAAMLEALAVQPGMHVLEIGTGTGYNAALLAELVAPDGQVVTLDIDAELTALAAERLRLAGYDQCVQVVTADGLQGYAPAAPYERIIATGSYRRIPSAWCEQLAPQGILVGDLVRSLTTPLFRLVKVGPKRLEGRLLPTPAFFMELRETEPAAPASRSHAPELGHWQKLPRLEEAETDLEGYELLYEPAFALWLELHLPGVERRLYPLPGPDNSQRLATGLLWQESLLLLCPNAVGPRPAHWRVEVYGAVPLWSHVQKLREQWLAIGAPSLEAYALEVAADGSYLLQLLA
ncbi:methyltransferase domain-containing protein [Thermogemmatispora sp.]|uniref:methyltransferase domain-containing protein n=1 Tax=Thermogemmatispora sp. TaxID=1968838 RepID=UPI001DCEFF81|nr:methyltransferase domain-containing protein [Thermogemmatispora sp.]MBX5449995.1 methyltransferase domain-containing protein [Thermogemmatispora sp.]